MTNPTTLTKQEEATLREVVASLTNTINELTAELNRYKVKIELNENPLIDAIEIKAYNLAENKERVGNNYAIASSQLAAIDAKDDQLLTSISKDFITKFLYHAYNGDKLVEELRGKLTNASIRLKRRMK